MRVVVDTNVLISAVIKPSGTAGKVLLRLRDGAYTILHSRALLNELVDVLQRPRLRDKYGITDEDIKTVAGLILLRGEHVTPTRRITACRDPRDDKSLEVAVSADADAIVSGDKDLLALAPFEDIPIMAPSTFLQRLNTLSE